MKLTVVIWFFILLFFWVLFPFMPQHNNSQCSKLKNKIKEQTISNISRKWRPKEWIQACNVINCLSDWNWLSEVKGLKERPFVLLFDVWLKCDLNWCVIQLFYMSRINKRGRETQVTIKLKTRQIKGIWSVERAVIWKFFLCVHKESNLNTFILGIF